MAARFLVGLVVISSLPCFAQATRFLPMIVWDHINPMLKCKCNWLTNIPKIDEYDRVDFMCPSLKVAVKLLDGYSRPTSEMNENIFRRKWEGNNLTKLGEVLHDGSFCDPTNSSTTKLYSCKNGKEGKSLGITFKESNDYKTGDIFVFFNNGDDGKATTLNSLAPKCSMVLVINITWSAKVKHDISYGKHLNPQGDTCDCTNIREPLNCKCNYVNPPLSTPYPTTSSSSSKPPTTTEKGPTTTLNISTVQGSTTTSNISTVQGSTITLHISTVQASTTTGHTTKPTNESNSTDGNTSPRDGPDEKWNVKTFLFGFIAGIAILGFVVLVCWLCKRKKLQQSKGCICMHSVHTIQNSTSPGYPNKAFQSSTLSRPEVKETVDVGTPLDCPDGQGPGYPNKAFQSSTPTVEVKGMIEVIAPVDCPDGQSRQKKTG